MAAETLAEKLLRLARLEGAPTHAQPSTKAVVLASAVAVAGSVVGNALVVVLATRLYPATSHFSHYRFVDYASLTILGALAASSAWPAVTRFSPAPRWLFFRLAVLVTVVLFAPDLWLLLTLHEPVREVGFLMAMHLVTALVVYNSLVHLAPVRPAGPVGALGDSPAVATSGEPQAAGGIGEESSPLVGKNAWFGRLAPLVALAVGIEFTLGVVALFAVKASRPSGWLPAGGRALYLAHGLFGLPLVAGALLLVALARRGSRSQRVLSWIGLVGVGLGGIGGLLTESHSLRLAGMGLMIVGTLVAGTGYLVPALDRLPPEVPENFVEAFADGPADDTAASEPINYNRNWPTPQEWPSNQPR